MRKTILIITAAALFFLPLLASAQSLPDVWNPSSIKGPLVTCQGNPYIFDSATGAMSINKYACTNLCDLVFTVETDIYVGIAFVIWIILPIMFIVAGIMYMMGGANPNLLTTAKSALKGAVIGAVIVLCAYLLISTFVTFLNVSQIGGFNGTSTCDSGSIPMPLAPQQPTGL